jgi:flagellar hook assembly protein FlgD
MNKPTIFGLAIVLVLVTGATVKASMSHGYSNIFSLDTLTSVGNDAGEPPPVTTITSVYPNPFNPRTTIMFDLAEATTIELAIFDLRGRLVQVVESGSRSVGRHQATWNGQDDNGRAVPTGTYFCRLSTSQGSQTKKLTLAK